MKMKKSLALILSLVVMFASIVAVSAEETDTSAKKKIAFVGDSITWGASCAEREKDSFVAIVKAEQADEYEVANFGRSSVSALTTAKYPYDQTEEYQSSLLFEPDILFIMFGTNDIKYENWDEGKDHFVSDYTKLINSYKEVNPSVEVFVGIPPRIFKENVFGERSPAILENEGIPAIYKVVEEVGATAIDLFTPTKDSAEYFTDYLHPNEEGHAVFAKLISDVMFASEDDVVISVTDGASEWAKQEIALAFSAELVPEKLTSDYIAKITREEFCEMVVNMLPENLEISREAKFADIENDAVSYAYGLGVVNGLSDDEFAPDKNITREEMAVMIQRVCSIIVPEASFEKGTYPDAAEISDWAVDSVDYVCGLGVMKGDENGNIMPKSNTTREQAILLVYRAYCAANTFGK